MVRGKRHLSTKSVEQVIQVFQLKSDEARFFRYLVRFNKAKTLSEKEHCAFKMIQFKKFQNEFPLSQEQFEYYSEWQNVALREILLLKKKIAKEENLGEQLIPAISKMDVNASLEKLTRLNLIMKQANGIVTPINENVTTGNTFSSFGVVNFHKKMLQLAGESLDRFQAREREISSVTIGLSDANFLKVKTLIEDFRSQLIQISEEDRNKDRLYQMNFQLFPLSKKEI